MLLKRIRSFYRHWYIRFSCQKDFFALKAEVELDINSLVNVSTGLNNLEIKVDYLDVGEVKTTPVNFRRLSDVVAEEYIKNIKFNTLKTKVNSLEKNIPDVTILIHIYQYNTDTWMLDRKTRDIDKKY